MKKITFILCIIFAAITWRNTSVFAADYSDVLSTNPFFGYIDDLNNLGFTDGIAPGLFGPEQMVSRAQFTKFAAAAFGMKDDGSPVPFADIEGHWASTYIRAAYQAGIVNGVSDTLFSPDHPVKRQEAATLIWRLAKKQGVYPSTILSFDKKPDTWAIEEVSSVISHKWYAADVKNTSGVWSYRPQEIMTRQEMAALLDLALKELRGSQTTKRAAKKDSSMYKATYLWDTAALLKDKEQVFPFLKKNGINVIYLQVDQDIPLNDYARFIKQADGLGIEVHAMDGAPDWVLPENQNRVHRLVQWVETYNARVPADHRFKGIRLDVEPYIMPVWSQNTDTMLGLWRDTFKIFIEEVKANDPDLTTGADLPTWLEKLHVPDGSGGQITFSNWLIRVLDQVTLMAYRDNSTDILGSVENELSEADLERKSVIIAVETMKSSEGPITFYPLGQAVLMQELGKVINTLQGRSSFKGYAVHHYGSWINLKE